MATQNPPLSENQALIRLILFITAILLAGWLYDNRTKPTTPKAPTATSSRSDLRVEPAIGSGTTTTNPQQAASPIENSGSVQSAPSDLQQAQNRSQLPEPIKQELGL